MTPEIIEGLLVCLIFVLSLTVLTPVMLYCLNFYPTATVPLSNGSPSRPRRFTLRHIRLKMSKVST